MEQDDIPDTLVDSSPSTVTRSTPRGDPVIESSRSVSTAPTSVSDTGEFKQAAIEQKDEIPIDNHTTKECPDEEAKYVVPGSSANDHARANDALESKNPVDRSSETKHTSIGSSKVVFTSSVKGPPSTFPSHNTAVATSRPNVPGTQPSVSGKRDSTGSSQYSSNKADSGSDVSSHPTISSLQNPVGLLSSKELLQKTSNEHLEAKVSSAEEFNADEMFQPTSRSTTLDLANTSGACANGASELQHRAKHPAVFSPGVDEAEKALKAPKAPKKHWTRRKLLYTGLALVAMATIVLRRRLPSR